ncbi:ASTRA complex subunit [Salvia divinorum]|uniref:ASTRA complex subunit n=1 Tax=Salvia divinorum TaxID=28513 RepID=A0ABD1GL26_SALDI
MHALTFSQRQSPVVRRVSTASNAAVSRRSRSSAVTFHLRTFPCSSLRTHSRVDEKRFIEASKTGNIIPLYKCIFSDHLTPVLAYRCLVNEDDKEAPSFLYESVEPGFRASSVGRYSVVGAQPAVEVLAKENQVTILDHISGKIIVEKFVKDPMTIPRSISELWRPQLVEDLPDAFCAYIIHWVRLDQYSSAQKAYDDGMKRLETLVSKVQDIDP